MTGVATAESSMALLPGAVGTAPNQKACSRSLSGWSWRRRDGGSARKVADPLPKVRDVPVAASEGFAAAGNLGQAWDGAGTLLDCSPDFQVATAPCPEIRQHWCPISRWWSSSHPRHG